MGTGDGNSDEQERAGRESGETLAAGHVGTTSSVPWDKRLVGLPAWGQA